VAVETCGPEERPVRRGEASELEKRLVDQGRGRLSYILRCRRAAVICLQREAVKQSIPSWVH
jgi:hypothetical protein